MGFIIQSKFDNKLYNMEKLERDLAYFKQALEKERDPERRRLLLQQIRDVEVDILALLTARREAVQRENRYMQEALDRLEKKDEPSK